MTHYIIGSGGQGRVIADILRAADSPDPVFIEPSDAAQRYQAGDLLYIGIGDNFARGRVARALCDELPQCRFGIAIHPAAVVARDATLGAGTVVMAGAIVNTAAVIGEHVILNTNSSVDHDCVIADFASIAPRVALGGTVRVGQYSAIGIGASISHGVQIGEHTVVGAGAVVVKSLPAYSVCYGVPARVMRSRAAGEAYL
jgi:sugar O-acyltransferase (sialic acid O-acetyltransferase NeuD family)